MRNSDLVRINIHCSISTVRICRAALMATQCTVHAWGDLPHMLRSVLLVQSELLTVSVVKKSECKFLTPGVTFL